MRTFAQMIERIRKTDEELMAAIVEASGYTLFQYHANNRKVDGRGENLAAQLIAACPVWLRPSMKGWLQQGKRDASRDMDYWQDFAAAKITGFFREQQAKREQARAKRAAKKAAPKVEAAQDAAAATPVDLTPSLAIVGPKGTLELTQDEYDAAVQAVLALRTGVLRIAA